LIIRSVGQESTDEYYCPMSFSYFLMNCSKQVQLCYAYFLILNLLKTKFKSKFLTLETLLKILKNLNGETRILEET